MSRILQIAMVIGGLLLLLWGYFQARIAERFVEAYCPGMSLDRSMSDVEATMNEKFTAHPALKQRTEKLFRQIQFALNDIDRLVEGATVGDGPGAMFDALCVQNGVEDLLVSMRYIVHETQELSANDSCTERLVQLRAAIDLFGSGPQWCERAFRKANAQESREFLHRVGKVLVTMGDQVVLSYDHPQKEVPWWMVGPLYGPCAAK